MCAVDRESWWLVCKLGLEMALQLSLEGCVGFNEERRAFQIKTRKKNEFLCVWHSKETNVSKTE